MALVEKVKLITAKAEQIEQLSMWEQPKAAKALIKDDVVPVLLEVAEFIDEMNSISEEGAELVNVADVLNDFQQQLKALEKRVTEIQKPATKKAAAEKAGA